MNREQVMEWAEKLAICSSASHKEFLHEGLLELVAFVASAEREECAKVCDAFVDIKEAERSRKRVEDSIGGCLDGEINAMRHELTVSTYNAGIKSCAAAIRARNTNKETK